MTYVDDRWLDQDGEDLLDQAVEEILDTIDKIAADWDLELYLDLTEALSFAVAALADATRADLAKRARAVQS